MSRWFEAAAAGGPLRLVLPDAEDQPPADAHGEAHRTAPGANDDSPHGQAGDPLDAALALAPGEPLLQWLEAWWQTALDPQPVAAWSTPVAGAGPWLWVQARHTASTPAWRLGLPWPQLLAAGPAPAGCPWAWPTLAWRAELARYGQPPLPATALGGTGADTAGALLLPPSFESAWRVLLRCAEPALQAEAVWTGPGHAWQLCGPPEAADADTQADLGEPKEAGTWWVELAEPWQASVPAVLGWPVAAPALDGSPRPAPPQRPPSGHAQLCSPAVGTSPGPRWLGEVVPALGGAALWLPAPPPPAMATPDEAHAWT